METLEITQEDIDKAIELRKGENDLGYSILEHCVISIAAKRQFPDVDCTAGGSLYNRESEVIYIGEDSLFEYMCAFDRREYEKLSPRTFEITKV